MMTFEQLYNTYFQDVFQFSIWLTRDRTRAEDIASETFVRAWAKRDRLRTETLKGYLLATARNIFLKQRRRARRLEELPEVVVDTAPDPHRTTGARFDLESIANALASFPMTERMALVLRSEHALPYDEIARVLEISAGSARVKVHRARRRLLAQTMNSNGGES